MTNLAHRPEFFNRASATNRLPDHASLMMAARTIERSYSVSAGLAKIVAELAASSVVRP
jgi:hypothetical protein